MKILIVVMMALSLNVHADTMSELVRTRTR